MNEDKNITQNGKKGGNLVGKPHKNKNGKDVGGIKAIVTDAGGRPVELEGGEVIINKEASKKHWKELSRINQSAGGGVPIEKPIDPHDEDPQEYAKGGKIQFNPNRLPNKWILKYAQNIKKNHPEIWKKGGNIYGNQAFKNLERVSERGYWLDSEEWFYIKWRSFVARHKGDFRIAGVVAMLKWVDKVDKGWQYMKNLIEEEIKKIEAKKSKGGWTTSRKKRMSKGGDVVIDETVANNPLSNPKVGMAIVNKDDAEEIFPVVYYVLDVKKNDSGTVGSLRVGFKDNSYSFGITPDIFRSNYLPASQKQVNFDKKIDKGIFEKGGKVDTYRDKYNRKFGYTKGTSHSLEAISKDTGVGLKGIQKIYNKGIGAYKTNPQSVRPNVKSKEQWAYARVYSSVMGGNAAEVDKNELNMAKGGNIDNDEFILRLNKGDSFSILYDSSIKSKNKRVLTFTGKRRLKSGIVKYTFKNKGNLSGVKYYAYDRGNGLTFAEGDMGISNVSFEELTTKPEPKAIKKPTLNNSYKVGDKGIYSGKQDKDVEITKITAKNVYFVDENGSEKRSEKKNFERLFTPDSFLAPRDFKPKKKQNNPVISNDIDDSIDYLKLFKKEFSKNFSIHEYSNKTWGLIKMSDFILMVKENKMLSKDKIQDMYNQILKIS